MNWFQRILCWLTDVPAPPGWASGALEQEPPDPPYIDEDLKAQHERNAWGKVHGI